MRFQGLSHTTQFVLGRRAILATPYLDWCGTGTLEFTGRIVLIVLVEAVDFPTIGLGLSAEEVTEWGHIGNGVWITMG